ncbi:hypothetical protein [Streptomyces sp. CRN 30]|uniref:hypothetical protein n=1 Tax=Streptomyces sp. CRN 30 TaxID=3075613 RepID=UPI002A841762|nr:hypothetical protein [Streptomyces sp. CRN 30]
MDRTEGLGRPRQEGKAAAAGRTAQEGAQHGADVVREKGQEVAGTAREGAEHVLRETTERGRDLYERLREQAAEETGTQVRRLATNIRYLAEDLRYMSETGKPESPAASLVSQVAERGQTLADRLDREGPGELLDGVRDFARRRPGLFLAGAALAGFAVSRLGRGVTAAGGTATEERPAVDERTDVPPLPASAPRTGAQVPPVPASAPRTETQVPPVPPSSFGSQPSPPPATPQPGPRGGEGTRQPGRGR